MILKDAENIYLGGNLVKKIYLGSTLVYTYITSAPPVVSEENIVGSNSAESYEEGSETWGDFTLSSGCTVSQDGIEIQDEETYISTEISDLSYPMAFEFKGRLDEACYSAQDSGPGMLFGLSPVQNEWGTGITCYATTDYGIIVDTMSAMTIVTNKTPTYVHIVIVVDSSGALTMYLNGINNSWTAAANDATMSNKNYVYNGQGVGRFVGAINVMRWWNSELSVSEVTELFSADSDEYTL